MTFIENFKSVNWVDIATYLSIFLTLVIFFYQEFSARIEGKKEVKRIVDEIVDLVIRNHASKQIGLTQVDLGYIVTGFENLKQSKLAITMSGFLKTIYAKVYTNEHITTEIRIDILRDLEDKINDMESDEQFLDTENKIRIEWRKKNEILSSIICILLLTFFYKYVLALEYFRSDILLTLVLIFCTLIFVIYWLKPNLSILLKFITKKQLTRELLIATLNSYKTKDRRTTRTHRVSSLIDVASQEKKSKETKPVKKVEPGEDIKKERVPPPINGNSKSSKQINNEKVEQHKPGPIWEFLSEEFTTREINSIKSILEKRFIFEFLIRRIYFRIYGSSTRLPYGKILSRLYNDGVVTVEVYKIAREILRSSSYVAHEGELVPGQGIAYNDFDSLSKDFYYLLKKIKIIDNELTEEQINSIRKNIMETND